LLCTPQHTTPHHNTSQPFTTHQLGTQTKYAQEEAHKKGTTGLGLHGAGGMGVFGFGLGFWVMGLGLGVSRFSGLGSWVWVWGVLGFPSWGCLLWFWFVAGLGLGFGFRQHTHTHNYSLAGALVGWGACPMGCPSMHASGLATGPISRCTLPCMHVPGRCRHAGFHLSQVAGMHKKVSLLGLSKARQGKARHGIYICHTQPALLHFTSLGPPSPCPGEGLLPVELVPAPLQVPWVDTLLGQPAWPA